jgi:hypothetical protein
MHPSSSWSSLCWPRRCAARGRSWKGFWIQSSGRWVRLRSLTGTSQSATYRLDRAERPGGHGRPDRARAHEATRRLRTRLGASRRWSLSRAGRHPEERDRRRRVAAGRPATPPERRCAGAPAPAPTFLRETPTQAPIPCLRACRLAPLVSTPSRRCHHLFTDPRPAQRRIFTGASGA